MALTRDFKETVMARVKAEPDFAQSLFNEAISLFLNGEPEIAKAILRDLVNATVGFEEFATEIDKSSKSLHRMLSENGNPTMNSLSAIFETLRNILHLKKVSIVKQTPAVYSKKVGRKKTSSKI